MPSDYTEKWNIEGDSAKWIFSALGFPASDSNLITTVYFIQENGWKIDKIVRTQKYDDGSIIETVTYD